MTILESRQTPATVTTTVIRDDESQRLYLKETPSETRNIDLRAPEDAQMACYTPKIIIGALDKLEPHPSKYRLIYRLVVLVSRGVRTAVLLD